MAKHRIVSPSTTYEDIVTPNWQTKDKSDTLLRNCITRKRKKSDFCDSSPAPSSVSSEMDLYERTTFYGSVLESETLLNNIPIKRTAPATMKQTSSCSGKNRDKPSPNNSDVAESVNSDLEFLEAENDAAKLRRTRNERNGPALNFYTHEEDVKIVKCVIKRKRIFRTRGNLLWQKIAEKKFSNTRTFQSLRNRFLKYIKPDILTKFAEYLDEKSVENLKKVFPELNKKKGQLPIRPAFRFGVQPNQYSYDERIINVSSDSGSDSEVSKNDSLHRLEKSKCTSIKERIYTTSESRDDNDCQSPRKCNFKSTDSDEEKTRPRKRKPSPSASADFETVKKKPSTSKFQLEVKSLARSKAVTSVCNNKMNEVTSARSKPSPASKSPLTSKSATSMCNNKASQVTSGRSKPSPVRKSPRTSKSVTSVSNNKANEVTSVRSKPSPVRKSPCTSTSATSECNNKTNQVTSARSKPSPTRKSPRTSKSITSASINKMSQVSTTQADKPKVPFKHDNNQVTRLEETDSETEDDIIKETPDQELTGGGIPKKTLNLFNAQVLKKLRKRVKPDLNHEDKNNDKNNEESPSLLIGNNNQVQNSKTDVKSCENSTNNLIDDKTVHEVIKTVINKLSSDVKPNSSVMFKSLKVLSGKDEDVIKVTLQKFDKNSKENKTVQNAVNFTNRKLVLDIDMIVDSGKNGVIQNEKETSDISRTAVSSNVNQNQNQHQQNSGLCESGPKVQILKADEKVPVPKMKKNKVKMTRRLTDINECSPIINILYQNTLELCHQVLIDSDDSEPETVQNYIEVLNGIKNKYCEKEVKENNLYESESSDTDINEMVESVKTKVQDDDCQMVMNKGRSKRPRPKVVTVKKEETSPKAVKDVKSQKDVNELLGNMMKMLSVPNQRRLNKRLREL